MQIAYPHYHLSRQGRVFTSSVDYLKPLLESGGAPHPRDDRIPAPPKVASLFPTCKVHMLWGKFSGRLGRVGGRPLVGAHFRFRAGSEPWLEGSGAPVGLCPRSHFFTSINLQA